MKHFFFSEPNIFCTQLREHRLGNHLRRLLPARSGRDYRFPALGVYRSGPGICNGQVRSPRVGTSTAGCEESAGHHRDWEHRDAGRTLDVCDALRRRQHRVLLGGICLPSHCQLVVPRPTGFPRKHQRPFDEHLVRPLQFSLCTTTPILIGTTGAFAGWGRYVRLAFCNGDTTITQPTTLSWARPSPRSCLLRLRLRTWHTPLSFNT